MEKNYERNKAMNNVLKKTMFFVGKGIRKFSYWWNIPYHKSKI